MNKYILVFGCLLFLIVSFISPNSSINEINDCATYCAGYSDSKVPNKKGDKNLKKWKKQYDACMKKRGCKQAKKLDPVRIKEVRGKD